MKEKKPAYGGSGRGKQRGDCPCFIRLQYIKVSGNSTSKILSFLADLFVNNPYNRDYYHSVLEVQVPENGECPIYVIEMQDYIDEHSERVRVGQIKSGYFASGYFGMFVSALVGPAYGIRKWRNGEVQDINEPGLAHPNPQVLSTDCDKAQELLNMVSQVPSHRYGTDWSSNSVISWLLQKNGLKPQNVSPPVHGITPGWREGIVAAGG